MHEYARDLAECGVALTGAAAVRLYDDHVDAVHALLTRRVGPVLSPDLTAETFEYAVRSWERFDRATGKERLFLFGAATTILRRYPAAETANLFGLRRPVVVSAPVDDPLVSRTRVRAPKVVGEPDPGVTPPTPTPAATPDDLAQPMQAVVELAADDRDILLLTCWEDCSQAEVAEILAMPVGAVRTSLGRIRRELKLATRDPGPLT